MGARITLYILGGCVAVAAVLFIVMIVLSMLRPPQLATPEPRTLRAFRDQQTLVLPPPGRIGRILGGLFVAVLLLATPVAVEPSLIDPLCDDYEWAGAEPAQVAREYAREANAAIEAPLLRSDRPR